MTNYISTHTRAEIDAAVDRIGDISLVKYTQTKYNAMISHDIIILNEEATE